ncbi:MAG TPA: sigma-70 family RNA polymerase sigma factor [Gemmatimonadales bacterium]|nr:sigma-70 family RNA polymerase sigma factor [Gemmatimonadales bacterium]
MLDALLAASDPEAQRVAWEQFLETYSGLLLRSAFHLGRSYDGGMDRYLFVLDQLRSGNFRRLRQFRATGTARFSTWLVVVARRLCLDHGRRHYGRSRGIPNAANECARALRRRLVDMATEQVEVTDLEDDSGPSPETALETGERVRALDAVLEHLDARSLLLLKLRFGNGLTAREISELLGYPSQFHVYRELRALLDQVRSALLEAGFDGSGE